MKKIILAWLLAFSGTPLFANQILTYPKLYFEYGYPFDAECPSDPQKPITNEMRQELLAMIASLDQHWSQESPALLGHVIKKFNKSFARKELSATLVLCGTTHPMSYPFLINMRKHLKSISNDPTPLFIFTYVVFHELVHRYLWENFNELDANSILLKKYASEDQIVKNHLHVLAVIKYVYVMLQREVELQEIVKRDAQAPAYKRAWEIINDIEGYQPFVDEL